MAGNPTWRYDSLMQAKGDTTCWSKEYAYDTLNRLKKARRGKVNDWGGTPTLASSSPTPTVWDWSQQDGSSKDGLDKLGNWNYFKVGAEGSEVTDDRGHNDVNEVSSRSFTNRQAPTWDANGNLTCDGITDHSPFGNNTKYNFKYDYRNRLVEVTDDSANVVAEYVYDGLNRRVRKVTWDGEETPAETSDTWYLWDGWQCIEERDHNDRDSVLRQYVYGPGYIDHHVALIDSEGDIYYYLQDRMANVTALADSTGAVVERYDYEPYGGLRIFAENGTTSRTTSSYAAKNALFFGV